MELGGARQRTGFNVHVRPNTDENLCPVGTLTCYISRTECYRFNNNQGVFLSLLAPYKTIKADYIARCIDFAISRAGLSVFSAKDYQPTGATLANESGNNEPII